MTRFTNAELEDLKRHFKSASKKQKIMITNAKGHEEERNVEVMNKHQFRSQMGLLGQQSHPFLANRIFEVFDRKRRELLVFDQFAAIMDVLCNGTEDQRN